MRHTLLQAERRTDGHHRVSDLQLFDVRGLEMSRDGRRILTSSGDNTMRLWDYDSAATLRLFRSPKGSIQSQSLSQDGNFVAGVFDDGAAVVWSVDGLSPASARLVHTWNISSARWSKDGSSVLTASGDGTATLSDVETSHPEFTLQTGTNDALAAFFTPDGREIITLDGKSQLRAWSALDGSEKRLIAKSEDFMKSALITPDGKSIIASIYGGLRVFDAAATNGTALRTLHAADLWLFVTSAARYGDRIPWENLERARDRGLQVGVVLGHVGVADAGVVGVAAAEHVVEIAAIGVEAGGKSVADRGRRADAGPT